MPIGKEQWRAGVGQSNVFSTSHPFNKCRNQCILVPIVQWAHHIKIKSLRKSHDHTPKKGIWKLAFSITVVACLLHLSGDVELNPGPTYLTPNDLRTVYKLAHDACSKWYVIGLELRLKWATLNIIESNDSHDVERCFRKVLLEWLKIADPPPTLEEFMTVLKQKHIGFPSLAKQIGEEFGSSDQTVSLPEQETTSQDTSGAVSGSFDTDDFFKQPLKKQIKSLQSQFKKISDRTFDKIEGSGMTVSKLKVRLTSSLPVEYRQSHKEFYQQVAKKIKQCSEVGEIWTEFSDQYWNYLNYTQLKSVIDGLDDPNLDKIMSNYVELFERFCSRTRVCDFTQHSPATKKAVEADIKKFLIRLDLDWEECTLEKLNDVTDDIMHRFHLPNFTIYLKEFSPGSLLVTLSIPSALASHVKDNIANVEMTFMKEHGILSLSIDDTECKYSAVRHSAAYLKDIYSQMKGKNLAPFKLARIGRKETERNKLDKFAKDTLRGDVDDVLFEKFHMEEDVVGIPSYWTEHKQPRLVLIEGAPGVGKTTFSEHFCHKWSQGKHFNDYKLLVLLPLRDKRVRSAKNVSDLFQHFHIENVAEEVEESGGEGVALWLEAWDELQEEMRNGSSVFRDLVHGRVLPKATVFITSRPWATKNIRESTSLKVNQHVEIVSTPNIQLSRIMKNRVKPDIRDRFQEYVDSNPSIKAAMHTPVTADIVSDVFQWSQDTESPLPTTTTQLYTAFTCKLLMEYLSKVSGKQPQTILSLEEVPADIEKQLLNLCRQSWEGLVKQQLTFSSDAVGEDTLGLMRGVRELYVGEDSQISYHFIHLTLQEFLAAYHLTELSPGLQKQLVREHVSTGHMTVAVRFYFGLTSPNTTTSTLSSLREQCTNVIMSALLQQQSLKSDELQDQLPGYVPTRLKHTLAHNFMAHELMFQYITSQHESKSANVFHWLFESGDVKRHTAPLRPTKEVEVRSSYAWNPLDYYALGHSISHSNFQWNLTFWMASIGEEEMEVLCKGLASNVETTWKGEITKANFSRNRLTLENVKSLVKLPPQILHQIKELDLSATELDSNILSAFSAAIPKLTRLHGLSLRGNPNIGEGGAVEILNCLQHNKTPLKELNLLDTGVGEQDNEPLIQLIANGDLQTLRIPGDLLSFIVKCPHPNSTLHTLNLSESRLSKENIDSLASLLQQSVWQLMELHISKCSITGDGAAQLAKALTSNHSLTVLNMTANNIGDFGAVGLAKMFKSNTALRELHIGICRITSEGCIQLVTELTQNSTLRVLFICSNAIGIEGAKAIGKMLALNKTLEKLDIRKCSIKPEGCVAVASGLTENTTLRELWMRDNAIGLDGAKALGKMLELNKTLEELYLQRDVTLGEGVDFLTAGLQKNTTLRNLTLPKKYQRQSDPRVKWGL